MYATILFSIIMFFILAIAGGFATNAAVRVTKSDGYSNDYNLKKAHTYLTWTSVIIWILIFFIFAGIICYFMFGFVEDPFLAITVMNVIMYINLILILFVGIMSTIAAYYIGISKSNDKHKSYQQSIIASVLSIVSFAFVIFILVLSHLKKKEDSGQNIYKYAKLLAK